MSYDAVTCDGVTCDAFICDMLIYAPYHINAPYDMNASYDIQPIADRLPHNLEIVSKKNQRTRILPMGFTIGADFVPPNKTARMVNALS